MKICQRCVLPESYPGIRFDDSGVCNLCLEYESKEPDFESIREQVESLVREHVQSHPASYHVILAFSGGKDSTFTLKYLVEKFQARILALTVDNDFLSETARENCSAVTSHLGVDHIFFKPNPRAMTEVYRKSQLDGFHSLASLKRASGICLSCIQIINTQILNFAANYQIPIVAGGYLGGQIPTESGFMKQNLTVTGSIREAMLARLQETMSEESVRLFRQQTGSKRDIFVVNPMAYLNLSEEKIISDIQSTGWKMPPDTGKSSTNCLLNDFAIQQHLKRHGFHPYVAETAAMVRRGTISREHGLQKISSFTEPENFHEIERKLNRFTK